MWNLGGVIPRKSLNKWVGVDKAGRLTIKASNTIIKNINTPTIERQEPKDLTLFHNK